MEMPIVLVLDDEQDICRLLEITLNKMNLHVISVYSIEEAKLYLKKYHFKLCLTDMRLPDGSGLDWLTYLKENAPEIPVAVITAYGSTDLAVKALKKGAFDFISKPIDLEHLRHTIQEALKTYDVLPHLANDVLIGNTPAIEHLRNNIAKVIRSQAPIYISGPSGSGKELVARIIHQSSTRRNEAFIPVNCGAIPQELMESEFFGHIKGSFTGAIHDKIGFFQAAHKGTLFLDEVADLPLPMQVKLLRAIQEKAIRPVGSPKEIHVDVRLLSATHKILHHLVDKGLFRHDLFYRINVIELAVPSLQERREDIPILTDYLLKKLSLTSQESPPTLSPEAQQALNAYAFPGNVRELENILERAIVLSNGGAIQAHDLQLPYPATPLSSPPSFETPALTGSLDNYLLEKERLAILQALQQCNGNKTAAAKQLGLSFRTLRYRLKKLGIESD